MRLTTLTLRNYRVYEDLELELPPGVVGIYGANGAGKSTLIEAVRWGLFGRARTAKDEIRTSGRLDDCLVEVAFEHEGHSYAVRRSVTGLHHTVKASALADGLQVAEGVTDTARYVRSILGMDDNAFRASVFCEQKQLDAFSEQRPEDRRRLVLQLLGITPLDGARDNARRDAKARREEHDRLRSILPPLAAVEAAAQEADTRSEQAAGASVLAAGAEARAETEGQAAAAAVAALQAVARRHEALTAHGTAVRAERDGVARRVEELRVELANLAGAQGELDRLAEAADPEACAAAEQRLAGLEALAAAEAARARLPDPGPAPVVDEAPAAEARDGAEAAAARAAALEGERKAAAAHLDAAGQALEASRRLSADACCPLCGQELGEGFAAVEAHRATEAAEAEARLAALDAALAAARHASSVSGAEARREAAALDGARRRAAEHALAAARRDDAARAVALALAGLDPPPGPEEAARLRQEVAARRAALTRAAHLRGQLERRGPAEGELAAEQARLADAEARRLALLEEVRALAFDPAALAAATARATTAQAELEQARAAARAAALDAERARAAAEAAGKRLAEVEGQHAHLEELADQSRHLLRMAELMAAFRNAVVGTVGPQLSLRAAGLFAELTDGEYEQLAVDPETYEIRIRDQGEEYGMARYSGSETDLANLALRVAISEHVRFQSGGQVGLLVLDEVLGSLDEDRKGRMLLALTRLSGRFRQVLVVTHATDVKEQLPNAVEVRKLPGRRATARLLHG